MILFGLIEFLLVYMILKFNKPQVTRKDLRTGKEVSMLVFVQSKMQLRKIFDYETDQINESMDVRE